MIYLDYTVKRIKHSAEKIFYEKGFNGARIDDIAHSAGVSKSLLYYYFRSKEQLFQVIIEDSISLVIKSMSPVLKKGPAFFELIEQFIYHILILFKDNKKLLSFIISEYNQNFDKISFLLKPVLVFFEELEQKIRSQSLKENIKIKDTKHLLVNIISLCGWQIIGISVYSTDNHIGANANPANIVTIKENIFNLTTNTLISNG